jgi:Tfp pilus assembly protein PilV
MPDNQKNKKLHPKARRSAGQTLIETLAAAFILTMGISACVGLAIYALNSSGGIVKQIIGTGLAREGLEAVRNMRDTNWLQDTLVTNGCYNYTTSQNSAAPCYEKWIGDTQGNGGGVPYCLDPTHSAYCHGDDTTDNYYLGFDSSQSQFPWVLTQDSSSDFGLNFNNPDSGGTAWKQYGFYSPGSANNGVTCAASNSGYCREIIVTKNTAAPYNKDANLPLVEVQSQVWWTDTKCPKAASFAAALVSCRIELDTYLTNWKNF